MYQCGGCYMRRAYNNIPGGAKAIGDLLWPSALPCRQAVSLLPSTRRTSWIVIQMCCKKADLWARATQVTQIIKGRDATS